MKLRHVLLASFAVVLAVGAFLVHEFVQTMNAPTEQELLEAYPWTVPSDWLRSDSVTIKGRIEDYDAGKFGFTAMQCFLADVLVPESKTMVLDIAADGTFSKTFHVNYPLRQTFYAPESKVGFRKMPFFVRPGETVDITVRKGSLGRYRCEYASGSSRDVERWLRTSDKMERILASFSGFKGTTDDAKLDAELTWQMAMSKLERLARSENYTPMEVHLALADMQAKLAEAFLSYAGIRGFSLIKTIENDGDRQTEILDSTEWKKLCDYSTYDVLRRIDFASPLLLASPSIYILINRLRYAKPLEDEPRQPRDRLDALRRLMGTDSDNLTAQICAYTDMAESFSFWHDSERDKTYRLYLDALTHPFVREKAEQFRASKMAQADVTSPLPDGSAADLIRSLSAKHPGQYLFIDFWGMSCGPCRAAIQKSKSLRAELAGRSDVKLIFIAAENTSGGSEAYRKYVAEWLADEETLCVSPTEFARLQEMFQFSGIPHYETLTPDCRRVRSDLSIRGYDDFVRRLELLKEKTGQQ